MHPTYSATYSQAAARDNYQVADNCPDYSVYLQHKHKHTNIHQQQEHTDNKFRHAGSIGKVRNRNKMPCNDVLMEF